MAPKGFEIGTDVDEALQFVRGFYEPLCMGEPTALTLKKHGQVVAAALYDGFTGGNVFIQVAGSPGTPWLTRAALRWAFGYPFSQLGVERVSAWVEADNERAIKFNEHVGFTLEHTLPRAGRKGQAVHLYRMFREDCRYA